MKMISSTIITSTKGVTLISAIGRARRWPRLRVRRSVFWIAAPMAQVSSWRDRMVANSSAKVSYPATMRSPSDDSLL